MEKTGLDSAELAAVFHDNAARLLGLSAPRYSPVWVFNQAVRVSICGSLNRAARCIQVYGKGGMSLPEISSTALFSRMDCLTGV